MGYAVYPYLVDLRHLRQAFGSRRADPVAEVERRCADEIARYDEGDDETTPSVREAVRDLIAGHLRPTDDLEQYGYALKILCHALGTPLPNEEWDGLTAKGLGVLPRVDGLAPLNEAPKLPIAIPGWSDFPGVTYLTSEEASALLTHDQPMAPLDEDSAADRAWLRRAHDQYLSWLRAAGKSGEALVAFLE